MLKKLIWNDVKQNKLMSAATVFFMAISAALLALTVLLCSNLLGAISTLMDSAIVPDFIQMHTGAVDDAALTRFSESREEVQDWQICHFLNLDNSNVALDGQSLIDSAQDNGLCVQGKRFDFLLGMDGTCPEVLPGEVYVPICYRDRYGLAAGSTMTIEGQTLTVAGFIRDAQMNSMMASSKRFLVSAADYALLRDQGEEEYLIEFLLRDGVDMNVFQTAYTASGLPANGPTITRPLVRMMNALSDGTMIFVIFLMSIIMLLISMLCIHFILSLQMERDRKEVGMLKALGIGRKEIRRLYFAKYLLFSLCGAFIGLGMAAILQKPLARQLQELYGTADQGGLKIFATLLAALLAEGIILLSIRHSLKKTDKISALDAMFQAQKAGKGYGKVLLIGFVTAACTFLMLVPQNLYNTVSSPKFVTYMGIGSAEIRIDIRQIKDIDSMTAQIAAALGKDPQVRKYAVLQTCSYPAALPDGGTVNLTVEAGDHSIFPVSFSAGTLPMNENEIALSSLNAEELKLSVGDTLDLNVNGKKSSYAVCGIYSDITNGGKTAKIHNRPDTAPVIWSVLYASLEESTDRQQWMARYRGMGVDVTDIEGYVRDTYAQTLAQLRLASRVAVGIAVLVTAVVLTLFLKLIVERERYAISLRKALGFTSETIKRTYFVKGLLPAVSGIVVGLTLGNLCGESLCGMVLKSFGADSFRFVINWGQVMAGIPIVILGVAILAVWAGISQIGQIKAYECCRGKE